MSLADQIATKSAGTKGGGSNQGLPCPIAYLRATLPADELATLEDALAAPWRVVPHVTLERALLAEGHAVGIGTVGKHRRGDCRCGKGSA